MTKERKVTFAKCQDISIVGALKYYQLNRTYNNYIKFNDQDEELANGYNFYLEKQFVPKTQKERFREFQLCMGYPKLANEINQEQNAFLEKIQSSSPRKRIKRYPYSLK